MHDPIVHDNVAAAEIRPALCFQSRQKFVANPANKAAMSVSAVSSVTEMTPVWSSPRGPSCRANLANSAARVLAPISASVQRNLAPLCADFDLLHQIGFADYGDQLLVLVEHGKRTDVVLDQEFDSFRDVDLGIHGHDLAYHDIARPYRLLLVLRRWARPAQLIP